MLGQDDTPFITIYLDDVTPFLPEKDALRIVLRYLHDHGIEGDMGSDERGAYVRYYTPQDDFEDFSAEFFRFITNGGK